PSAAANTARSAQVRRQRYWRTSTPAAATSHTASRMRDGTQAKPVNAAGLLTPTSPGTIRNAITTAKTPSAATNDSVVVAVSAANATTGMLTVSSIQTAHATAAAADCPTGKPLPTPCRTSITSSGPCTKM